MRRLVVGSVRALQAPLISLAHSAVIWVGQLAVKTNIEPVSG